MSASAACTACSFFQVNTYKAVFSHVWVFPLVLQFLFVLYGGQTFNTVGKTIFVGCVGEDDDIGRLEPIFLLVKPGSFPLEVEFSRHH